MSESANIDRLSGDALDLVALFFHRVVVMGLMPCNAVEVRLDDPVAHLLDGGEGLRAHGGGGGRHYLRHASDPDWAIVRSYDPEWTPYKATAGEMALRAIEKWFSDES